MVSSHWPRPWLEATARAAGACLFSLLSGDPQSGAELPTNHGSAGGTLANQGAGLETNSIHFPFITSKVLSGI